MASLGIGFNQNFGTSTKKKNQTAGGAFGQGSFAQRGTTLNSSNIPVGAVMGFPGEQIGITPAVNPNVYQQQGGVPASRPTQDVSSTTSIEDVFLEGLYQERDKALGEAASQMAASGVEMGTAGGAALMEIYNKFGLDAAIALAGFEQQDVTNKLQQQQQLMALLGGGGGSGSSGAAAGGQGANYLMNQLTDKGWSKEEVYDYFGGQAQYEQQVLFDSLRRKMMQEIFALSL
jgi:hypothetical protein